MEEVSPAVKSLREASEKRLQEQENQWIKLEQSLRELLESKLSIIEKDIKYIKDQNQANKYRLEAILKEKGLKLVIGKNVKGQVIVKENTRIEIQKRSLLDKLKGEY